MQDIMNKDVLYNLLINPIKENFTKFIRNNNGEQNEIDFKLKFIEKGHLAKTILAMANSGGGLIIFGVNELEDGKCEPSGLDKFEDKAVIYSQQQKYLPEKLKYDIFDFDYDTSDYEKLKNKKFQILIVSNIPEFLPYISKSNDNNIDKDIIYIRRGTRNEKVNNEELQRIINKRVETMYSSTSQLELQEHLNQLKLLYNNIKKTNTTSYFENISEFFTSMAVNISEKNKYYPNEEFDEFISKLIQHKKIKIEKILDLK